MPKLVEVGAFDCESWSHSHHLICEGWEGLFFEPQIWLANKCRQCYQDNPLVIVDDCAIGDHEGTVKLYGARTLESLATTRLDMLPVFRKQGYNILDRQFVYVPMYTLDSRLDHHGWSEDFELLVIDVEGAEMAVLNGFSIDRWRPRRVIIEACDPCVDELLEEKTRLIREYFTKYGYIQIDQDGFDITFERIEEATVTKELVELADGDKLEVMHDGKTVWIEDWNDASHRQLVTLYISDLPVLISVLNKIYQGSLSVQGKQ